MLVENQEETIKFLLSDLAFGPKPPGMRAIMTHISIIFLIGQRAIKLKRAVRLPYVDFSTPEKRLEACERELILNRRTAPSLYRSLHRVTRETDGQLALDGEGAVVDAVVEMARFDEDGLFDRMALAGKLTAPMMTKLAREIATFHANAVMDHSLGGTAAMAAVLDINERAFALTDVFPADELAGFNSAFRSALRSHSALLDVRASAGKVRRGHGDLHLRNICLIADKPTLFDCLEFDDALATTDVLYDLAFLLMDLWHRGMDRLANIVFNRYLDEADEEDGLPLVPFFMAVRAAVRAHVIAAQVADAGTEAAAVRAETRCYFDLALRLLDPRAARLVAIGGLSGSGKSTVAAAVAPDIGPAPGARILASDRVRKHLFGVRAETKLPADAYRPEVSGDVYAIIAGRAAEILRHGHAVVTDAVFDRPANRIIIEAVAAREGGPFNGLWLEAHYDVLLQRVATRHNDPSDATTEVVREQAQKPIGWIGWTRLSSDLDAESVCAEARRKVSESHSSIICQKQSQFNLEAASS